MSLVIRHPHHPPKDKMVTALWQGRQRLRYVEWIYHLKMMVTSRRAPLNMKDSCSLTVLFSQFVTVQERAK